MRERRYAVRVLGQVAEPRPKCKNPTIHDALWLKKVGMALVAFQVCKNVRVNLTDWERTGCLQLDLELHENQDRGIAERWRFNGGQNVVAGPHAKNPWRALTERGAIRYVRRFQRFLVPVEACAAHDTKHVLKLIVADGDLGKIITTETDLRLVHGAY